jgi:hypothetical protein
VRRFSTTDRCNSATGQVCTQPVSRDLILLDFLDVAQDQFEGPQFLTRKRTTQGVLSQCAVIITILG